MAQSREPHRPRRIMLGLNRVPLVYGSQHASDSPVQWPGRRPGQCVVPFSRIRSLLVALDGTPAAEHALPYALAIARRSGATVRLVHVHSLLDSVKPWQQYYSAKLVERLRRQKQAYLQSIIRRLGRRGDVQIAAVVIESGDIANSLCEAAAGAALVVMASRGRGLLGRLLYGSVTETLMRALPCPLLRVGGSVSAVDLADDPMPRHILIPLDGTKFAERIFDAAAAIGSLSRARFTLAHLQHVGAAQLWPDRSGARGYLREAAMRFERLVPNVHTEFVISNRRTAPAILSLIKEEGIDMVALTTQGRHGLARLTKGNVAASVARRTETPVLVFHPLVPQAERQDPGRARSLLSWM